MVINLNLEECNLLISLLTSSISETKEEIFKTDRHEFKEELKNEKALMEAILSRLVDASMRGEKPN